MEMTIEEAENYLIALKHCKTCEANDTNICKACPHYRRGSSAKCYDAIDVAIETMDKYQKIEKVYHTFNNDIDFPLAMYNIGGVLDGNDN